MTNNLKIEVLVSNIPEDGSIASQFPSREYVNQQLAKKANLSPEGRLDPSHAPDYTEIPGLYEHIEDTKDAIETSIADSLQDAKGYTNQQLSTGLRTKADLVNGKIPFDQIPFSADIEDQIQINVENITAVVDQKVAQVVEQVNGVATAANSYTDTKVAETKTYVDTTVGNVIEDAERLGVSKAVTIPTYLTPEAGVAAGTGVAAGAYFNARSTEDDTVLVEYQNVGGVATPTGKSYPSSQVVERLQEGYAIKKYLLDNGVGESELDGDYDFLMQRLAQIAVDKGLGASFVVDGDKTQKQINAEIAIKTRYANNIVVTPENFGADTSKADNSNEIQAAIDFVVANGGWLDGGSKTYKAANLVIDSNTHIRNIYLENNVFDANMVSVITTETADALRTPLTNVELINVHINGKRSELTGMPTGSFSEDGGRHGFRFVRPINGLVMRGCSANYCGVDGIIIYPIRDISHTEWQYWVKNVVIENCDFHFNGRHGGSSDSCNGLTLRDCRLSGNGTDLINGAPSNTGNAGRRDLVSDKLYGNGWDCEEYYGHAASTNVNFINCTMIDNAGSGLNFTRTGGITKVMDNLLVVGGKYNKGIAAEFNDNAIHLGGYLIDFYNWYEITLIDVDFSGDEFYILRSKATLINPKNLGLASANDRSTLYYDKPDLKILNWASAVLLSAQLEVKPDGVSQQQVIGISGITGASSGLLFYDKSANIVRGGIEVESNSSVDSSMYLSVQGNRRWMILANGALLPMQDAVSSIGYINNRVSTIYLATAPVVGSDIKYKKDVESISDVEREVAIELKSCIKKYRLIDSDDKHHIGLIAQEVESVFAKHGLNAHDYKLLQYSADSETYALVYEQLMLFIISAM